MRGMFVDLLASKLWRKPISACSGLSEYSLDDHPSWDNSRVASMSVLFEALSLLPYQWGDLQRKSYFLKISQGRVWFVRFWRAACALSQLCNQSTPPTHPHWLPIFPRPPGRSYEQASIFQRLETGMKRAKPAQRTCVYFSLDKILVLETRISPNPFFLVLNLEHGFLFGEAASRLFTGSDQMAHSYICLGFDQCY